MDKELLKKHHFWVLLGVFLLPALAVAAFLFTSVNAATKESLSKIDKHGKDLESSAKSAQSKYLESGLNEQKKVLVDRRMIMWEEAWKNQESIYTWPESLDTTVKGNLQTLAFGAEIVNPDHRSFIRNEDAYLKEYKNITDEKKNIVQFNGGWQSILKYVPSWDQRAVPESEEIWLAFEDFWVQRELIRIVQAVNQSAALFKEVPKEEFADAKPQHKRFRNRFWEVELKVVPQADGKGDVLEGTIRNISDRLQVFGRKNEILLNVYLDPTDATPFLFNIEGDYLVAGDPTPRKVKTLPSHRLTRSVTELSKVEQVFDTLTVPIWRIDRVAMGFASNRTFPLTPKMSSFSEAIVAKIKEASGGGAEGGGGMMGSPGAGGGKGGMPSEGGMGGTTAAASATNLTPTGLERNRYVTVTKQVRRMQVGMVLILDQAFLPDVLEAFSNSKLRCQNTQYHWKRHRTGRGASPTASGSGGIGGPANEGGSSGDLPGGPIGGFNPGGLAPSGPGGFGGFGGFGGNVAQNTEGLSVSMIELSIYGIASLYEKYNPNIDDVVEAEAKKN